MVDSDRQDRTRLQIGTKPARRADEALDAVTAANDRTQALPQDFEANTRAAAIDTPTEVMDAAPATAAPKPPKLDILKNRFVLERVLGAGGMGVVYKAKDLLKVEAKDRDPYVAIKVLGEEFKSHPQAFIALQRESRKTQRIAHPNIVNVHDFDKDGDTVFMTMEYLEGSPLDRLIKQYSATGIPHEDVWQIVDGLCAALAYAHQQRIVHADLKPGNIFVTAGNTAKVFDFGIARAVAEAEIHESDHAEDKTVFDAGSLGALTPAYASLEMLQGSAPDVRDDIYALGCIVYEMLTGKHPYQRKNAKEVVRLGLRPARIPGLEPNRWRAIERALSIRRSSRLASVGEFRALLSQKPSRAYRQWIIAMVLATVVGGGVIYRLEQQSPPAPQPQVSEQEVRSEIEQLVRVELVGKNLNELINSATFEQSWQDLLWEEMQNLQALVGADDPLVRNFHKRITALLSQHIAAVLEQGELDSAAQLIAYSQRFVPDQEALSTLNSRLERLRAEQNADQQAMEEQARLAEQQRQESLQREREQAQSQRAFAAALANVNAELDCRRGVAFNDLAVAVKQLRSLDSERARAAEGPLVEKLAGCIQTLAKTDPPEARALRSATLPLFDNHRLLQGIVIADKDPCSPALAGLGARNKRATCQDNLKSGGRSPRLVVVPKGRDFAAFAIGRYEVSVAEFNEFCDASRACQSIASPDKTLPATGLGVEQVQAYLRWLSDQSGYVYRFPTLAEWRHAASASGAAGSASPICQLNARGLEIGGALVQASLGQQNGWGLVNAVGNAREWVRSGSTYAAAGGSFATAMAECSTRTVHKVAQSGDSQTGFRVARTLAVK